MIVVAHRRNSLESLRATPTHLGVEMDVRIRGERLVVAHDPFEDGADLDEWLDAFGHALLIVNVKEEGLERLILPKLAARGIQDFFFLDQSFPFLMRTLRAGERRCAIRVSEHEHHATALSLADKAGWVWLDGFYGFPVTPDVARSLKAAGYRVCLVSPELHGRSEDEITSFQRAARDTGVEFDAVCTRSWTAWSA